MSARHAGAPLLLIALAACGDVPTASESIVPSLNSGNGVLYHANGGGGYDQPLPASLGGGSVVIDVNMNTAIRGNGEVKGKFRHSGKVQGQSLDFEGEVTCAVVDPVLKRAWIGGVITRNRSTHPSFTGAINQVGRDIWFRVADLGNGGSGLADRITFVGFEGGGGILTSAQYCEARIWPNDANPLVRGNLMVK